MYGTMYGTMKPRYQTTYKELKLASTPSGHQITYVIRLPIRN